ncbi:UbiA family prenyltransferase [Oceanomicrobium pacificus]|uniref:UbiA family prenyltransferase n=1 Tax=Oceanomicrobium pacificus TaxID=2692916 RepID=A0A6B0TVT5_9RHOB|nr:UbiA family prenyltransferase [Oceanomicrobium pacificus]MXU65342.1 UbiA family prenyltransferase [Oceanomicrobium pacificus]
MSGATCPLVVDVDGTLLRTDLLQESFLAAMGRAPVAAASFTAKHLSNRPALKLGLADQAGLDSDLLPLNEAVLGLIEEAKSEGRPIVLASGGAEPLVQALADRIGGVDRVMGTVDGTNLTAGRKAAALVDAYGENGFDYVGDSMADLPVWAVARRAYLTAPRARVEAGLRRAGIDFEILSPHWRLRDMVRGIRPHQWIKNSLMFLPLIAAHVSDPAAWLLVFLGAVAFSLGASSIYIVNDLLDLSADRRHATKHKRPFAAGAVPLRIGAAASVLLATMAIVLGISLHLHFLAVLLVYICLSLAYSLKLKRLRWVDIAVLATLYSLRVLAGAEIVSVDVTGWLLGFIFPSFLALGCVKRLTELAKAKSDDRLPGRGYGRADMGDLTNVAVVGAVAALIVLGFYIHSGQAQALYTRHWVLWLAVPFVALWFERMIRTGRQGLQQYDPIVFALRDPKGVALIAVSLFWFVLASF